MTDMQILTLCVSIGVPLGLLLLSNSRVNDARDLLRAEIQTLRTEMEKGHVEILASLDKIATSVRTLETTLDTRMKMHVLEHHR